MVGFVNVYKPKGVTSFNIVAGIRKIYNQKRVGHLGTLDPMAEGVLPIAVGKATKFFDYFLNKDKEYDAVFKAGVLTDTLDADGEVIQQNNYIPSFEEVKNSCNKFLGKISQIPPKFSAKKINGKRAYELARQGIDFNLKPKEVQIYALKAEMGEINNLFNLKIHCSAGTYIRSLGNDIFANINSLATMVKLVRTRSGCFKIENSFSMENIEADKIITLTKVEDALSDIPRINLSDEDAHKFKSGLSVPCIELNNGEAFAFLNNENLGLGEIKNNNMKIKISLWE